jgi:predicted GIY-YIG superfamily endonuclease
VRDANKQAYIGKTERILSQRINEHLNPKKDSAIQTHLQENPSHVFDPDNIEILDKANSNFKIRLKKNNCTSSHTSLNSIVNMQLHPKENTIKICSSPT